MQAAARAMKLNAGIARFYTILPANRLWCEAKAGPQRRYAARKGEKPRLCRCRSAGGVNAAVVARLSYWAGKCRNRRLVEEAFHLVRRLAHEAKFNFLTVAGLFMVYLYRRPHLKKKNTFLRLNNS